MTKTAKPTEKKKYAKLDIGQLHTIEGHPYKVIDNEEMNELTESIRENGIYTPLIVRPMENTENEYEVVSGHRRLHAAKQAGLSEIPALIYPLDRNAAAIAVVDSNLHREHLLPSEKAFAYRMKLEALKAQGKRSDLTSSQVATKSDTAAEIGAATGESRDTVYRYIRLTYLIPELLDRMDEGKMALSVGVELSYLDDQLQYDILDACELNECTPSYAQAVRMRKAYNAGTLARDGINEIMSEAKANQRDKLTIPMERLKGKIPSSYDEPQIQEVGHRSGGSRYCSRHFQNVYRGQR